MARTPHSWETPAPKELIWGTSTAGTSLSHINTSGTGSICMSNSQIKHVNRWQVNILIHTVFLLLVSSWQLRTVTPKSAKNNTQSGPALKSFFSSNFALIFCSTLLIMKLTWPRKHCYNFKVTSEIHMTYEQMEGQMRCKHPAKPHYQSGLFSQATSRAHKEVWKYKDSKTNLGSDPFLGEVQIHFLTPRIKESFPKAHPCFSCATWHAAWDAPHRDPPCFLSSL